MKIPKWVGFVGCLSFLGWCAIYHYGRRAGQEDMRTAWKDEPDVPNFWWKAAALFLVLLVAAACLNTGFAVAQQAAQYQQIADSETFINQTFNPTNARELEQQALGLAFIFLAVGIVPFIYAGVHGGTLVYRHGFHVGNLLRPQPRRRVGLGKRDRLVTSRRARQT